VADRCLELTRHSAGRCLSLMTSTKCYRIPRSFSSSTSYVDDVTEDYFWAYVSVFIS